MTRAELVLDASTVRHALGHFASGVTVVTTLSAASQPMGTTASAVCSVSLDPPLMLVCLDRASETLAALREHRAFAINVLAEGQEHLSSNFARRGAASSWEGVKHRIGPGGVPWLGDVLATLDCRLEQSLAAGDHEIVIGRLTELELAVGAPLLHFRSGYAGLVLNRSGDAARRGDPDLR
jgi:flavin reductase (DIM6/NTAB) family NADH-FMN oxidoreductase RutF